MCDENIPIVREDNISRFWISFTTWFVDELPGMEYPNVLKLELPQIEDIKMFIKLAFNEWILFEK